MGWIKTRPAQKQLVRVKFTGNSYSYRTCVNVNGHYGNTRKLVFTGTRLPGLVLVSMWTHPYACTSCRENRSAVAAGRERFENCTEYSDTKVSNAIPLHRMWSLNEDVAAQVEMHTTILPSSSHSLWLHTMREAASKTRNTQRWQDAFKAKATV